jgi:hypothetical protein
MGASIARWARERLSEKLVGTRGSRVGFAPEAAELKFLGGSRDSRFGGRHGGFV